jgi:hypothetical protein
MSIEMIRPPRLKKVKQPVTEITPVIKNEQKQLQVVRFFDLLKIKNTYIISRFLH